MQEIKNIAMNLIKKNIFLRRIIKFLLYLCRKIIYFKFYLTNRVDDKTILFESFMGRAYSDSQKALYLEMQKDKFFENFTFVWAFNNKENYKYLEKNNTIVIKYKSKDFYNYMAKSKYWITNFRLPEHIIKKKKQIYIQCWHGTPLKKLGVDIKVEGGNCLNTIKEIKEKYELDAKRYNYLLSPSAYCTEKFISAFNLKKLHKENIIIEEGYPRNDYLFNYTEDNVNKLKNTLGIPKNKKVILYVPTWRDNKHTTGLGYTYDLNLDFDKLKEKLEKDYVIIFRAHYLISNSFDFEKYKGFIFDMSNHDDVNECYILSDMMVTDYSSVFFDYANLKRPIFFYMHDLEEYKEKVRDFYINIEELPGPIIKNQEDLEKAIAEIDKYENKYKEKYIKVNEKYNYLDDGEVSKRVIKRIFKHEIID